MSISNDRHTEYVIPHQWVKAESIKISHPEDIPAFVTGVYCYSGSGYCAECAQGLEAADISSYEVEATAMIVCENCGK